MRGTHRNSRACWAPACNHGYTCTRRNQARSCRSGRTCLCRAHTRRCLQNEQRGTDLGWVDPGSGSELCVCVCVCVCVGLNRTCCPASGCIPSSMSRCAPSKPGVPLPHPDVPSTPKSTPPYPGAPSIPRSTHHRRTCRRCSECTPPYSRTYKHGHRSLGFSVTKSQSQSFIYF